MTQKTKDQIKPLAETIRKNFNPKDIILFGSHAYGVPSGSSDVDLLVIMDTALKPYKQAALIRLKLDEAFRPDFPKYLRELNEALKTSEVMGEICLYGGAVICIFFEARPSTKDVDAIFQPQEKMRALIKQVGKNHGMREDWLNDAVKGFVVSHSSRVFLDLSHLKIFVPEPDYLLAMKTISARVEGTDRDDVEFLIHKMGIKNPEEVFSIVEKYYPRERIEPKSKFFIEELFGK